NDLGVVLHFEDMDLTDTHVLEPKWVTAAVYKIINSPLLAKHKGILMTGHLPEILKKEGDDDYQYPKGKYGFILTLMEKFELCYSIDSKTVLIPDLLPVPEPGFDFDYADSLKFIIDYDFLPRSVMPRFIVRLHKDIKAEKKKKLQWRTGVVLKGKGFKSTAVVKADHEAKRIFIYVTGEQKRDYLSVIRHTIRDINGDFKKLGVTELVPLPDSDGRTVT
ncbi:MAG: hypothetical protein GY940_36870, partial [bacterium]|nr:hypothetical protein [bacterium]